MTTKELQFTLDKALEVAKEKDREIQKAKEENKIIQGVNLGLCDELANLRQINKRLKNSISKALFTHISTSIDSQSDVCFDYEPTSKGFELNIQEPDHTRARMTISAIIGIAAGFILALILL
jgi:tRNA uridine 5-carbamoylmethylation protein Kti12